MTALHELARCAQYLEAALEHAGGTHTLDNVVASIYSGVLQFWPGDKSAIVTEIEVYPRMKVCHLFLGGGDLTEICEMVRKIEVWAKEQGCSQMSLTGRKGWERSPLRGDGYTTRGWLMAKEIV